MIKNIIKYFFLRELLFVSMLFELFGCSMTQGQPILRSKQLCEPLFNIFYYPDKIHFESAPDVIYKCKGFEKHRGNFFLYGKASSNNVTFYYVSGWVEIFFDGSNEGVRHFEADDSGFIVAVSSKDCRYENARWVFEPTPEGRKIAARLGISEGVISELLWDAINREIQAFGGKHELFKNIAENRINDSDLKVILPADVFEKFKKLRKEK